MLSGCDDSILITNLHFTNLHIAYASGKDHQEHSEVEQVQFHNSPVKKRIYTIGGAPVWRCRKDYRTRDLVGILQRLHRKRGVYSR